ncbi:MAG TPA: glycosyltransferase family 39 protein [Verrucomicrobiae bacterium]|nr:glycosyltransferase family 39 protein [Verrucomicrobiae bacterium]
MVPTTTRKYVFVFALVTAVGTTLFLHFWKIGSVPRGFIGDECSIAYNAYCLAQTGADEYGTPWPMYFRGIEVYYEPADVYSVLIPIRVFGLEEWAARVPCGVYYVLACAAFYLLLRHWRVEAPLALAGAFLLSVIPWAFPTSRSCTYAGHTVALLALVTGLVLTASAVRSQSKGRAVLAGVAWALALYGHQSIQPVLALLAVGCAIVLWHRLIPRWRLLLLMLLSALIVSLPLIISILRSPGGLVARFQQVSITHEASSPVEMLAGAARRYCGYFSPRFLFISGDGQLRHHTGHGGELYWCLAPLILAGLYVSIRQWRQSASHRVILVGILASPVSAALTMDQMHSTRSVYAVIFWLLLATVGAQWCWQRRGPWRMLVLAVACAGALEITLYMRDYFGAYQTRDSQALQTELTDALEYCFGHLGRNDVLYISASTFDPYGATVNAQLKPQLYAYVLFFGRIDPRTYQRAGIPTREVRLYDGHAPEPGLLLRSSNYYFRLNDGSGRILGVPDKAPLPAGARLIKTFPFTGPCSFAKYEVFALP